MSHENCMYASRFLEKEWAYLNDKETSSNYPVADRIWKILPQRIEEKVIMIYGQFFLEPFSLTFQDICHCFMFWSMRNIRSLLTS